jgi:DNA mismatch repair protein MutL
MSGIFVLPDHLVNQIAAGEVIERPASVVKELLENALDALASRVSVELTHGGRTRILVEDDGSGIAADDLPLALQRHATSKLRTERDLFAIATLGFRGEALPSIASVSRMTLSSRPVAAREGGLLRVEGGKMGELEPCGLFAGTRVEVEDLFFNVPARRKFLRSPATELTHVLTLMEHYALARPEVAFKLVSDGRTILNLAPVLDHAQRFFELFSEMPREDFVPVEREGAAATISGLVGKPERNLGSARYQFTLVNGRFVRDRLLQHAISHGYSDTHPKGRYPVVLLALELPLDRVDVNVHPAKREVRFVESQAVHQAVSRAIRQAIAPGRPLPEEDAPAAGGWGGAFPRASEQAGLFAAGSRAPLNAEATQALFTPTGGEPQVLQGAPLRALAQWRSSFILCDSPEGLAVVDQHVAHERLRFEQLKRFLDAPGPRQPFVIPQTYALPRSVAHRVEEFAELITAQGFEAEPMGEAVIAVRSAPAFLRPGESERLLTEFFDSAAEVIKTPRERWKEVLVMRSCRGSVMLHDALTLDRMQYLLDALFALGAPLTCPHGRPIVFTLKEADLLAKFDRR